jgi:hypothetical protein
MRFGLNRSVRVAAAAAVVLIGSAAAGVAAAETAFVTAGTLNCREAAAPSAGVLVKLSYGQQVTIQSRQGDWARVERSGGDACWASDRYLSDEEPEVRAAPELPSYASSASARRARSGVNSRSRSTQARALSSSTSARRSSARSSRRSQGLSSGSCPCSGGSVCIGPRGGRYCITSGGNKRYGVSDPATAPSLRVLESLRLSST